MKAAIVVIAYNRPKALQRLLSSINEASYFRKDIPLIISIDKANNQCDVLKVANDFKWTFGEKTVRTYSTRQGLRKHVLQCGDLVNKFENVIILEDDLIVSPSYYTYVDQALEFYKNCDKIAGIALYSHEWNGYANKNFAPIIDKYDTYMGQFSITWGQCWTRESWLKFKTWYINQKVSLGNNEYLPQKINRWPQQSWGKYFITYIVAMDKYYVIPRISLSTNFSEIGEDVQAQDSDHQVRLLYDNKQMFNFAPFEFAEKYDVFFENTRLQSQFPSEMSIEGIDIDLNGEGRRNINNRYVLTTLVLPYKIINSYGLVLRPIEMNIIKAVQGNDIYLYDTHICAKKKASNIDRIYRYEVRGISLFKLFEYIINAAIIRIKHKNQK